MPELPTALAQVLQRPDPASLVTLQEALLMEAPAGADRSEALDAAGRFHDYLLDLQGKLSARKFSELASWMDIAAMGAVAFEDILSGQASGLFDLALGLLAEGLMVAGSRQHVKAWEVEARLSHDRAAWFLREAYWRMSEQGQPDLPPQARITSLRSLIAPANAETVSSQRILVLGQLFQLLLLLYGTRLLRARSA